MNDATLERLMMDAAVGGLSEDVRELLMAHLAGDEKRVREMEALRALMGRARQAVREESWAEPQLRPMRSWKIQRAMTWGGRIVAMAACLLIGFGIARVGAPRPVEVVVREKPVNPPVVAVNDARATSEGELWSAQRIYRNAVEVNRSEKPKVGTKRIFQ